MPWRETPATAVLALTTIVISVLLTLAGAEAYASVVAGFIPALASGAALPPEIGLAVPWWLTPFSATLVHGGLFHLGFNMVMLIYCGRQVERALGSACFAILYLVGGYAAAAGQWLPDPHATAPMIGASGAISAIIAAYALLYGQRRARAIGPVPAGIVHVAWLAAAWIGINLLMGVAGLGGVTIAVGAHIGGFLAGLALTRPMLLLRYRGA